MKNKKKKLNTNIMGMIIGAIFGFVIAFIFGYVLGKNLQDIPRTEYFLLLIPFLIFLYTSIVMHIIIHESGHLIGGKLSGYQFISFTVINMVFIKQNGKLTRKKFYIPGAGGQCLMIPPEPINGSYPFLLYNLGGSIMNFFGSFFFALIYIIIPENSPYISAIFIPPIGVGILFGLLNLIPLKFGGVANDGSNIVLLRKNEKARRAFRIVLMIQAQAIAGVRIKDMPAEWFDLPDDYNNQISASTAISQFSYLMDNHNFKEAKEFGEKILSEADQILELHKNELCCELLFLEIIGDKHKEEIDRLYTKDLKRYIKAAKSQLPKQRLLYAYAKLIALDETEAKKVLEKFNGLCLTYPFTGEIEAERELIAIVDNLEIKQ
jgi:hypothetical protein